MRKAATVPDDEALDAYERAFALYEGDFVDGYLFSWADDYRVDYKKRLVDALRQAAEIAVRLGESQRGVRFYQLILERETTDEDAARELMRRRWGGRHQRCPQDRQGARGSDPAGAR